MAVVKHFRLLKAELISLHGQQYFALCCSWCCNRHRTCGGRSTSHY